MVHFFIGIMVFGAGSSVALGLYWFGSPKYYEVGHAPEQPIPFSHKKHVGEMGMDCRFCHSNVEHSHEANIPPGQTCMNCHRQVKTDSLKLAPLRDLFTNPTDAAEPLKEKENANLKWKKVHDLPDYAYFDHSAHLNAGVGCKSCHGRIDQMEVVRQEKELSMAWCLDCHRDPAKHIRPDHVSVTDMHWEAGSLDKKESQSLMLKRNIKPPQDCASCHR